MNKTWILATMALTLAASCSRDRDVDNQDNNKIDDTTIEEIVLGTGQSVSISPSTRGIGAVGNLEATNSWNGETVYVYGINNGATGDAQFAINGQAATAPTTATGGLKWAKWDEGTKDYIADDDTHYYYNSNDVYDFYGAHVDDAVKDFTTVMPIPSKTNLDEGFAVNVEIDGSQDLMVAKPTRKDDIDKANATLETDILYADSTKLYSAWSARRYVTPNLVFSHLLTRLRFQAVCGNETVPTDGEEIYIDSIKIANTLYKGSLQIIPSKEKETVVEQGLTPVTTDSIPFYVKEAPADGGNLVELEAEAVTAKKDEAPIVIGEDLLLIPAEYYDIYIYVSQTLNEKKETNYVYKRLKASDVTKDNTEGEGQVNAGKSQFMKNELYYINIVLRGIEEIEINGTLNPWTEGGNAVIDDEDI